ncbi:MAG: HNH endonuclease domain-containing protein [Anaerostipes sp.]|nr:HNH endonuclease domain-containing protein [Anaerostipes sp.]
MVEFDPTKTGYQLNIDQKYYNSLDILSFTQMMKAPSYCYKFYWLEAIVNLIVDDVVDTTFDAVIDEMIANAWYSVVEFHIHLSGVIGGDVRDGLERAVVKLHKLSKVSSNASKVEIKNAIKQYNKEISDEKKQLTNMVPYRALAGFFHESGQTPDWGSARRMVAYIEMINKNHVLLPYTLGESSKLNKEIHFNSAWMQMIIDNNIAIRGWIQYEKIKWLQMNNPEMPGLVYKMDQLDNKMRKLSNVRNLWEAILNVTTINDVFTGNEIVKGDYDVDHFIPWSFVMNDELWNLMPMDSSLNSSKSNRLPKWEPFFATFAKNQYDLYLAIHEKEGIHRLYEKCYRDNLHTIWANQELYREGNSRETFITILDQNMHPVYDSARRQGYEIWDY